LHDKTKRTKLVSASEGTATRRCDMRLLGARSR
jgi:hypothetical protein